MTESNLSTPAYSSRPARPPRPKLENPVRAAVTSWLGTLPPGLLESITIDAAQLLSGTPKRWVVYPPMVLLPAGSFGSEAWRAILRREATSSNVDELWRALLRTIGQREGKGTLTHLAINAGIPLHRAPGSAPEQEAPSASGSGDEAENILRSPSGLVMLSGDFGPRLPPDAEPSPRDFAEAFWVRTRQNGITQVWAPRYTMFSRGNVKEKARLLHFHTLGTGSGAWGKEVLKDAAAVDLYAGIGYFVFSYAKMGVGRVVGWELNPWSVEGLRRGAIANHWSVKVVERGVPLASGDDAQIIVFREDNSLALERIQESASRHLDHTRHVNCGLLPTSEMVWEMALRILLLDGWLHLHENVGVGDVQARAVAIEHRFAAWLRARGGSRVARVEHVELVKTFAPGVWHCVFDVRITRADTIASLPA